MKNMCPYIVLGRVKIQIKSDRTVIATVLGVLAYASFASNPSLDSTNSIFQSWFDFPYDPDHPYQNNWKISFEK
jgi:hypothetical protein